MTKLLTILCCLFLLSCTKQQETVATNAVKQYQKSTHRPTRSKISVQLLLNLNGGAENTADGVAIFYDNSFSKTIGNEDSYKWENEDENLAIAENDTSLSIEGKPYAHSDTTQLTMWTFRQTSYYLKISASDFPDGYSLYLTDTYLNTTQQLNIDGSSFIAFDAVDMPYRYELILK